MVKKFGGEYELKDVDIRTSTIEAQKLFLELLWEMKPDVVFDLTRLFNFDSMPVDWQDKPDQIDFATKLFLFHTQYESAYKNDLTKFGFKSDVRDTPVLAYFDFIHKNRPEFNKLLEKSEENWKQLTSEPGTPLIISWALQELIPDWKTLQLRNDSEWLCRTLIQWAKRWNLNNDWCLDFALECLKNSKIRLFDTFRIPENYLETKTFDLLRSFYLFRQLGSAWSWALWDARWKYHKDNSILTTIPDYPSFEYKWKQIAENEVEEFFTIAGTYNPFTMSKESLYCRSYHKRRITEKS
jgi:hypothetical protein